MEKNTTYGLFVLLASAFFYASYGIFSKIIGDSFAPYTQVWTRSIVSLICFAAFCFYKKLFVKIKREDIKWYIGVGIIGALALAPTFYSLAKLNIGTALFIQYAATVIVSYLLGSLLLGEKLTRLSIIAFFLALIGLFLVYWGDVHFETSKIVPVIAVFLAGAFFSIWFVFGKKINNKYPSAQINTYGYVFGVAINLVIALLLKEPFNSNFTSTAWLANVGYGIAGFLGSGLTIYGFKFIAAHIGSIILLSEIIFGTLFGLILFHEILNFTTIAGGILIGISVILPNIYGRLTKQPPTEN